MRKGVDIGGSFVKVFWEDGRKERIFVKEFSKDREAFLNQLRCIILDGAPEKVGVAVAGYTSLEGKVWRSPNIPILDGLNLKAFVEDLGIPCVVANDVSAGAYGLWYYYHRNSKSLVFVAIGTGLGGGLVMGGKPYLGSCGSAMELGHHIIHSGGEVCSCGRRGCWEAYCSSYGLERIYYKFSGEKLKDFQIARRAKENHPNAMKAVEIFKEYLMVGLVSTVHILNPDTLVLGGGLIEGLKELLGNLEEELKKRIENLPSSCLKVGYAPCAEFCMAMGALALTYSDDI